MKLLDASCGTAPERWVGYCPPPRLYQAQTKGNAIVAAMEELCMPILEL